MPLEQLHQVLQIVALAGLAFWVPIILDRKRWWPLQWSLHLVAAADRSRPGSLGEVAVVIPARNEASTLPRTLPRLLKQGDWCHVIVVVDDRSEDTTATTARRLGAGSPAEDKLRVISAGPPPEGWAGKPHALHKGLEVALADWHGDPSKQWILFTDADILHATSTIGRLLTKAATDGYDLVSVMVKLRAGGFWNGLLVPPFVYFFQLLYPFRRASDSRSRIAAAAGGCILVRRSMLEQIGGLESIKGKIIDDLALVRRVKRAGGRCWVGLDPDMLSLRTYVGIPDIVRMVARSAFEQLGYHYFLVPVVWFGLVVFFVAPPALVVYGAVTRDGLIVGAALLAWLLQSANFLPVVQYLEVPSAFALTLPFAALAYAFMTTLSAWRHHTGKGIAWREPGETDNTSD